MENNKKKGLVKRVNDLPKGEREKIKKIIDRIGDKDFDLNKANLEFCDIILKGK